MLYWVLVVVCGILLGDLFAGIFHWWEDRYGRESWPILGKYVVQPNIEHHKHPAAMGNATYLSNSLYSMVVAIPLALLCLYSGQYVLAVAFLVASQSNEIHSYAHGKHRNKLVTFLQAVGLFQSPKYHAVHHQRPYDKRYCVTTVYVNPVLHAIGFWAILEAVVWLLTNVKPNPAREVY